MSGQSGFAESQDEFRFKYAKLKKLFTPVFTRGGEIYFSDADRNFEIHPTSTDAQLNDWLASAPPPEAGLSLDGREL